METERWQQVKQIFDEAVDSPGSDRSNLLSSACGEDDSLRAEVEALLNAHEDAGEFLSSPTRGSPSAADNLDDSDVFMRLQRVLSGRYSLEHELGRGGMGIVYLARDVALDRRVAIKLLPPAMATMPDFRERFLREARTAAGLAHPNIVPIHLVEAKDDLVYFVMTFVEGESLGDRVRRAGPLKPADVAKLVQEVAWALAYAHSRGVIHRDVKPDNILIDSGSGHALVTDFGIARVTATGTVSQQGQILGTVQYMSPEQASADGTIDGRADLYSLGVTAFFALTGRLPFESDNPMALLTMHITEPAPPLRSVSKFVPARFAEAIDRCLAKDPDARYAECGALAVAIADAQITRREIAPSVREFLNAAKYGAVQVTALAALWMFLGVSGLGDTGSLGWIMLVVLSACTPLVLLLPVLAARGVVRAGLDQNHVAEAVASSSTVRDANIEYEIARAQYVANRFSRIWVRPVFFAWAAVVAVLVPGIVGDLIYAGSSLEGLGILIFLMLMGGSGAFSLGMAVAPKQTVAIVTRGTPENAGFLRKLWGGPLGRWFFKLAAIGLETAKAIPASEPQPTEVLIGSASNLLFEQLPKEQRARLGEVPDVIGRLEKAAATLRARRDELQQALAGVGSRAGSTKREQFITELEGVRRKVEARLAAAVAAMENLRLDLLRLRAGVGQPEDLTRAIAEARLVGEAVDVELEAKREVEAAI